MILLPSLSFSARVAVPPRAVVAHPEGLLHVVLHQLLGVAARAFDEADTLVHALLEAADLVGDAPLVV